MPRYQVMGAVFCSFIQIRKKHVFPTFFTFDPLNHFKSRICIHKRCPFSKIVYQTLHIITLKYVDYQTNIKSTDKYCIDQQKKKFKFLILLGFNYAESSVLPITQCEKYFFKQNLFNNFIEVKSSEKDVGFRHGFKISPP